MTRTDHRAALCAMSDVLVAYTRAVDATDQGALERCFTVGAVFATTIGGQLQGPVLEGNELIAASIAKSRKRDRDRRRHVVTNLRRSIRDDVGQIEAYLTVFSTHPGGRPALLCTGNYSAALLEDDRQLWLMDRLLIDLDSNPEDSPS